MHIPTAAAAYPAIASLRGPNVLRLGDFIARFRRVDFSKLPLNRAPDLHTLQGQVAAIRRSGRGMMFVDLAQDLARVQLMASNKLMGLTADDFSARHSPLKKGDYVSCVGYPSRTNVGELTLKLCRPVAVAAPCLKAAVVPEELVHKKKINSNRVLHLLTSHGAREKLLVKSRVVRSIRDFLQARDFTEVQTPLLHGASTGANAQPFVTTPNAVDTQLQLRVAPELWLKKLIIGGLDRIFEIGPSFRNEGIDATHNPEFTSCEFYQSFIGLPQLMATTEEMFAQIYRDLGDYELPLLKTVLPKLAALTEPYDRYEFVPTLEQRTGVALPAQLTSEALVEYHQTLGLALPGVRSPASLLDNLSSKYLESISVGHTKPVFIYNQPAVLSPLSKSTHIQYGDRQYDISLRFELFIDGKEYVNAYEEENSPQAQLAKFQLQQQSKEQFNDQESLIPDWNYIEQMEYGLPPTGGWGCGVDRLAMLFTDSERIDEVLPFGSIKDVLKN